MVAHTMYDMLERLAPTKPYSYRDFEEYDKYYSNDMRRYFVENYCWAIPSHEVIKKIAAFVGSDTILEIGAGSGLWASLIANEGTSIIATDNYQSQAKHGTYYKVERIKHTTALRKYGNQCNVLMLCWPPYGNEMADHALRLFKGSKVISIGETNGCTGTSNFYRRLRAYFDCEDIDIPQWESIHDYMQLGVRKSE